LDESDEDKKSVDFEVEGFYEEQVKKQGLIQRLENFDERVLQKLLRKEVYDEAHDPLGVFTKEQEVHKSLEDTSYKDVGAIPKHRQSIMHNKNIPAKAFHVQFSLPMEDTSKGKDANFLSPESRATVRRSTIHANKIDPSAIKRLSVLNVS